MEGLGRDVLIRILSSCSCRDVLALGCTSRELSKMLQDDELWRDLAEHKWGPAVRQLAQVPAGQWAAWTKHRLSSSSSVISPLNLVQEHYQGDAFQHIVVCVLCARTTGGPAVRDAIQLFMSLYPTPTAVLEGRPSGMREVMQPLGLPDARFAGVRGIAHDFLGTAWQEPADFKHCGKFVTDSWRIFCRGHRSLQGIEDKNLQRYLRWRLSGIVQDKAAGERRRPAAKRKAQADRVKEAEAGTLRSGRRRGGSGAAGGCHAAPPAGERRTTRAAAAAADKPGPAPLAGPGKRARAA